MITPYNTEIYEEILAEICLNFKRNFRDLICIKKRVDKSLLAFLVRVRGLEPPPNCSDMNLNHTRLPVPPYPHILLCPAGNVLHYTAGLVVCQ